MNTILAELFLLLCLAWYVLFHKRRKRLYEMASEFEGPHPVPFLGNALKCRIPLTEIPNAMLEASRYYKSSAKLWFGSHLILYVWKPEDIEIVLNSPHALDKQPYLYKTFESVLGRGLITLPGNEWKRRRRLISPHFNSESAPEQFFHVLLKRSRKLVENMRDESGTFDVSSHLEVCVLNSILESFVGHYERDQMEKSFKKFLDGVLKRASNILYFTDFVFKMTPVGCTFAKEAREHRELVCSIIKKWQESHVNAAEGRPKTFVEHLLSTCDELGRLSKEELQEEINTFVITGLDTTSSMMGFLLLVLALEPNVQERVRHELDEILCEKPNLEFGDLARLTYLERVIKESLRMFPILAGIARYTDRDIPLNNRTIPSGTTVVIGILSLHRDPAVWPNPNKFDPDRFLPDREIHRHFYSWLPFSAGPRNCIAQRFAMVALKVLAVEILRNFEVATPYKSVDDVALKMVAVLKATRGFEISLKARSA